MKDITKGQRVRLAVFGALFAIFLLVYLLLPKTDQISHWIDELVSFTVLIILWGIRDVLMPDLLLYVGVLLGLEVLFLFVTPKFSLPRPAKIAVRVIMVVLVGAGLYWTVGTAVFKNPLPPMNFQVWICIFGGTHLIRELWWIAAAATTFAAVR